MKKYTPFELVMFWFGQIAATAFVVLVGLMLFTDIM